jgi:hypothetical protein
VVAGGASAVHGGPGGLDRGLRVRFRRVGHRPGRIVGGVGVAVQGVQGEVPSGVFEVAGYPFHGQPTRAPPAAADRLGRAAAYAGPKAGRPGVATVAVAATSAGPCTRPFRCESSRQLGVGPRRRRRLAPESSGARRLAVKWIANLKFSCRQRADSRQHTSPVGRSVREVSAGIWAPSSVGR